MKLVDEQDDGALGGVDLLQDRLEPVLELAAVLGAGDELAQVEGEDALALQGLGDVTGGDAPGDAFDHRGLADAGLADEDGVVLGAARQDLHGAADLLVAADDRVELALARKLGEVAGVALERVVLAFGVGVGHALGAAHLGQRLHGGLVVDAVGLEDARRRTVVAGEDREQEVLGGDELVLELAGLARRRVVELAEGASGSDLGARAPDDRQAVELAVELVLDALGIGADLGEEPRHHALLLAEEGDKEVCRRDLGMTLARGEISSVGDGFLGLDRELVGSHGR